MKTVYPPTNTVCRGGGGGGGGITSEMGSRHIYFRCDDDLSHATK